MSQSIPGNYPSPDQENVYYSVNALVTQLNTELSESTISSLKEMLNKFSLPVFVLDITDAPNSYIIKVYPKGSSPESITVSNEQLSQDTNTSMEPPLDEIPEKINDGCGEVELDPKFHSNSKIKQGDFKQAIHLDPNFNLDLSLLASTKWFWDENLLEEKNRYSNIVKQIVTNSLQNLPQELLNDYKYEYDYVVTSLEDVQQTLQKISDGERISIENIEKNLVKESYNLEKQFDTTTVVGQAMFDLNNASNGKIGKLNINSDFPIIDDEPLKYKDGGNNNGILDKSHELWGEFISQVLTLPTIEIPSGLNFKNPGEDEISNMLHFSDGGTRKETFKIDGWMQNWYYDNLAFKVEGTDPAYEILNRYVDQFTSTIEKLENISNFYSLKGNALVVVQSILRAIDRLCKSGLDVTKYAPKYPDNSTYFDKIQRSGVLGVSGLGPYPSKYSISQFPEVDSDGNVVDENLPPQPEDYGNSACFNYAALMRILQELFSPSNPSWSNGLNFMLKNINDGWHADHDETIGLWYQFSVEQSPLDLKPMSSLSPGAYSSASKRDDNLKVINHLYRRLNISSTRTASFDHTTIYLVPIKGLTQSADSDRTFVNFHLPLLAYNTESGYQQYSTQWKKGEWRSFGYHYPNSLNSSDKLFIANIPASFQAMGYTPKVEGPAPQETLLGGDNKIGYVRTKAVHYGWVNNQIEEETTATTGEDGKPPVPNRNVLDFYKYKAYSCPYLWVSMASLCRGLTTMVYEEFLESLKEIDPEFVSQFSAEELLEFMDNGKLWNVIGELVNLLTEDVVQLGMLVNTDGCITLFDPALKGSNIEWQLNRSERRNTPPNARQLMENYVKFVSLIGESRTINFVEDNKPISMLIEDHLPSAGLAREGSINYKNSHGGKGQYFNEDSIVPYFSFTNFVKSEINNTAINKNVSAIGEYPVFVELYNSFLSRHSDMYGHNNALKYVKKNLEEFRAFIDGFGVPATVSDLFTTGYFNSGEDLMGAKNLISQIKRQRPKFLINSKGYSRKEDWVTLDLSIREKFKNSYIYTIGIPEDSYDEEGKVYLRPRLLSGGQIYDGTLVPTFEFRKDLICLGNNSSGESLYMVEDTIKSQTEIPNIIQTMPICIKNSAELRTWLLHCFDLDFDESGFLKDPKLLDIKYSDPVIDNETGLFMWTSDDFEEGLPKRELDTTFNISPLIFPHNLLIDVSAPRKFHQIVHIPLSALQMGITSTVDLVGSIEWELVNP